MEIQGKIIAILPIQQGTSKSGSTWRKQEYVIETEGKYPKKMCFGVWGDKIDEFNIQSGDSLTVSFEVDAREWQGRWFNEIRAWKVERASVDAFGSSGGQMSQGRQEAVKQPASDHIGPEDDLPF